MECLLKNDADNRLFRKMVICGRSDIGKLLFVRPPGDKIHPAAEYVKIILIIIYWLNVR